MALPLQRQADHRPGVAPPDGRESHRADDFLLPDEIHSPPPESALAASLTQRSADLFRYQAALSPLATWTTRSGKEGGVERAVGAAQNRWRIQKP